MSTIPRNPNDDKWTLIRPLLTFILLASSVYLLATTEDWTGGLKPNLIIYSLALGSLCLFKRMGVLKVVLICTILTLSLCAYSSLAASESLFIVSNKSWLSMLTAVVCGSAYSWCLRSFNENKRRSEIYHAV